MCYHHGDGAELSLEVVGQLRAAGVTRVHGDEDGTARVQLNLAACAREADERADEVSSS